MSGVKNEKRDCMSHIEIFTKNDNFHSVCVLITLLVYIYHDSAVEEDSVILSPT